MTMEMFLILIAGMLLGAGAVLVWLQFSPTHAPAVRKQPSDQKCLPDQRCAARVAADLPTMPVGVMIVNERDYIVDLTQAVWRMLALDRSLPVIGRPLHEVLAAWPALQNLARPVEIEVTEGSTSHYYEVVAQDLLPGLSDSMTGWRAITIQDVTAREQVTTTLRHTYNKLAEAKEYVEAILNNSNDALIVTFEDFTIDQANPAFYTLLGYELDEMYSQPLGALFTQDALPTVMQTLENMTLDTGTARLEVPAHRKDGTVIHVDMMIAAINTRHGDYTGYVCTMRDITERIQAAIRREALIEDLDHFAHMVAHDLKGPLGNIRSATELILQGDSILSDLDIEVLQIIVSTTSKMANIIDELLLLAGVRRLHEVPAEPLEMGPLLRQVRQRMKYVVEQHRATIISPGEWPSARGYGPWVEEVWVNYISNAIKYGGDPPHVTLGATVEPNGTVRYWVRDNGQGLWPDQQARLFTEFTRLERIRAKGHGLGLSIVKRIVETLGGTVGVESIIGEGSTFSFTLPAHLPVDDALLSPENCQNQNSP